jgi:hypothetical protein
MLWDRLHMLCAGNQQVMCHRLRASMNVYSKWPPLTLWFCHTSVAGSVVCCSLVYRWASILVLPGFVESYSQLPSMNAKYHPCTISCMHWDKHKGVRALRERETLALLANMNKESVAMGVVLLDGSPGRALTGFCTHSQQICIWWWAFDTKELQRKIIILSNF